MNNIQLSKQFNDKLIELINNSNLSVDIVYYIMKSATAELQLLYEQTYYQQQTININDIGLRTEEAEPEVVTFDVPINMNNNLDENNEKKE